jgi:DNA-binding protein H-NS
MPAKRLKKSQRTTWETHAAMIDRSAQVARRRAQDNPDNLRFAEMAATMQKAQKIFPQLRKAAVEQNEKKFELAKTRLGKVLAAYADPDLRMSDWF